MKQTMSAFLLDMRDYYTEEKQRTELFLEKLLDEHGTPTGDTSTLCEKIHLFERILNEVDILLKMKG